MSNEVTLKPCAHCGHEARLRPVREKPWLQPDVECTHCGAEMAGGGITAWNTRADTSELLREARPFVEWFANRERGGAANTAKALLSGIDAHLKGEAQ